MSYNYLKIALRNLLKNKGFSLIQIAGLSIGICIALVIGMLVHHEFSYDTFHKDGERIYRIVSLTKFGDEEFPNSGVPAPLAEAVKNDIAGLEEVVAFHIWENVKVTIQQDNKAPESIKNVKEIIFTDEDFFKMFSYEWLVGSPLNAVNEPYKVVLSESRAKQYFPYEHLSQVIGKTILYQDSIQTTVSGIVKNHEHLSDLIFHEFISFSTIDKTYLKDEFYMEAWDNISSSSLLFVKLEKGVVAADINAQLPKLLKKYLSETNYGNQNNELQPLHDMHFNGSYDNFDKRTAHKPTLTGLSLLSLFILILACINFINLTTAQSGTREKEISVRKTFGSSKRQLVYQFLGESLVKVFFATVISILLLPYLFNHFSDFLPNDLVYQNYLSFFHLMILIPFIIILGILAGIYPAFILASFRPAWLLKKKFSGIESRQYFRQSLIVFQFVIAFCLIIGSFTVSKQIKYGLTKDLGFEKDAIVNVHMPWLSDHKKKEQFFQKLKSIPEIEKVSLGGQPPASFGTLSRGTDFLPKKDQPPILAEFKYGDPDYVKIYNLKILAGNHLSPSDTVREVLINETFAKQLGYEDPKDIIGHSVVFNEREKPIAGVVADFHSKSMHQPVKPLIITTDQQHYDLAHIKLLPNSENWQAALKKTELAWNEVFPDEAFEYHFFDQKIASFYDREVKLNKLLNWATGISIFISCLGLIGIVSLTIQQKTKEIGIRKVLGASISGILMLLSKGFVKLILLAFVIATPIGYYFIHIWLEDFTYKIEIYWWLFVLPGMAILAISIIVLSTQAVKAALANPVESLRNE